MQKKQMMEEEQSSSDNLVNEEEEDLCQICKSSHQIDDRYTQHYCYYALFRRMLNAIVNDASLQQEDQAKQKRRAINKNHRKANYIKHLIMTNKPELAEFKAKKYLKDVLLYEQKNQNPWIAKIVKYNIKVKYFCCPECGQQFKEHKGNALKHMKTYCFRNKEMLEPKEEYVCLKTYFRGE